MAKKFIEDIMSDGASMIKKSSLPNQGMFLTIHENIKRCYYLDANEKLVLFELYSWSSQDGNCKLTMDLISMKLGLSEKTVRTKIKSLKEKKFVTVKKERKSNKYIFNNLKENPYLILSEVIHTFIEDYYYKNGLQRDEEWFQQAGEDGVRIWREAIVESLTTVTRKKVNYEPVVKKLMGAITTEQFKQQNERITQQNQDLAIKKAELQSALEAKKDLNEQQQSFRKEVERFFNLDIDDEQVMKQILQRLIHKIEVFESGKIKIHYNLSNPLPSI